MVHNGIISAPPTRLSSRSGGIDIRVIRQRQLVFEGACLREGTRYDSSIKSGFQDDDTSLCQSNVQRHPPEGVTPPLETIRDGKNAKMSEHTRMQRSNCFSVAL